MSAALFAAGSVVLFAVALFLLAEYCWPDEIQIRLTEAPPAAPAVQGQRGRRPDDREPVRSEIAGPSSPAVRSALAEYDIRSFRQPAAKVFRRNTRRVQ